jgi:hypothetical protein
VITATVGQSKRFAGKFGLGGQHFERPQLTIELPAVYNSAKDDSKVPYK